MAGSRILRGIILAALVPLAALIVYQLMVRISDGGARVSEQPPPERTASFNLVEIVGSNEGRREYLLQAAEAQGATVGPQKIEGLEVLKIFREDGRVIELTGREGSSPRGSVLPRGPDGAARVRLEGGLHLEEPDGPAIDAEWFEFDQGRGHVWTDAPVTMLLQDYEARASGLSYSTEGRRLTLEGGVHVLGPEREGSRLELWAPVLHYDIDARRAEVPRSEGDGIAIHRGIERVSGEMAVFNLAREGEPEDEAVIRGRVQGALLPPAGSGRPVLFAAGEMDARRSAGGGPLRKAFLRDGTRVWWRNAAGAVQVLTSEEIETVLDAEGAVRQVIARGDAELLIREPGTVSRRLGAAVLTAELGPGPILTAARARGGVRYEGPGDLVVRAARAERAVDGRLLLRGEDAGRPTILDPESTVVAAEVDVLPGGDVVQARGGVETSFVPSREEGAGAGLFEADRPVQVRSDELDMHQSAERAVFRGAVQAIQEDSMLRAEEVEILRGREVHGRGAVRMRLLREREDLGRIPVHVDADEVVYRDEDAVVRFEGNVRYSEQGLELDADELHGQLAEAGSFRWVEATGTVTLLARGRDEEGRPVEIEGTGISLRLEGDAGEIVLRGGKEPARVVNRTTEEELRGPVLRLFLEDDRLVAGAPGNGGRTTIKKILTEDER